MRPDDDEPAVRQPRLLELVEQARAQPLPPLRTGSDAILRAVAQRRSARTRAAVIGVVLCAAAAWVLWARAVPTWTCADASDCATDYYCLLGCCYPPPPG